MSFEEIDTIGDHKIFKYDISNHDFIHFFINLYKEKNLDQLHLKSENYNLLKYKLMLGVLNEVDTDLHEIFYKEIKINDTFKIKYCNFVKDIYDYFFPQEKFMIFQSFPSIRIQYPESVTVPPHKDSDFLSNHPIGEKNFLIPITNMEKTNSIYIESEPDKKDFKSISLRQGEFFYFNGNTCTHYNESNKENKLRISLDFRIIQSLDYINYIKNLDIKKTNPRDIQMKRKPTLMIAGAYYQIFERNTDSKSLINWYKIKEIPQHRPYFGKEEAEATNKYMLEDSFITEFKKTKELEIMLSDYLNCKHCIMTTSGTSSIILSLMCLDLEEGDEVIVPNYTMIATINAIKLLKLKPILTDVNKDTFTIDLENINKNISEKTKVVIHVSLNNRYKSLKSISEFCISKNLILIEDSAQSIGCKVNGKSLGTFGKIGCFSLSTPKIISTGQGGFCVTDDDTLASKMRMIKNFGRKESGKDNFEEFGINLKFTDLQAVIGIEQVKKLDNRVKRMREIYKLYYYYLKDVVDIKRPLDEKEWIPWFVDIFTEKRQGLSEFLKKHKVFTRFVYQEISKSKIYYSDKYFENTHYCCNNGLFLPSHIMLSDSDIEYICKLIIFYFNK